MCDGISKAVTNGIPRGDAEETFKGTYTEISKNAWASWKEIDKVLKVLTFGFFFWKMFLKFLCLYF